MAFVHTIIRDLYSRSAEQTRTQTQTIARKFKEKPFQVRENPTFLKCSQSRICKSLIYFILPPSPWFWLKLKYSGVYTVAYSTAADRPSIFSLAGREPSCCDPTSQLWSKNSVKALGEGGGMKYEWIQLCFDGYVSKYPSKRLLKARKSVCVVEIGSSSPVSTPASSRVAFHFIF